MNNINFQELCGNHWLIMNISNSYKQDNLSKHVGILSWEQGSGLFEQ